MDENENLNFAFAFISVHSRLPRLRTKNPSHRIPLNVQHSRFELSLTHPSFSSYKTHRRPFYAQVAQPYHHWLFFKTTFLVGN